MTSALVFNSEVLAVSNERPVELCFQLQQRGLVHWDLRDMEQQIVYSSEAAVQPAGYRALTWHGLTQSGAAVAEGTYLYQIYSNRRPIKSGLLIVN